MKNRRVVIDYTNHMGVRAMRVVEPTGGVFFGSNEWHRELQWLMPVKMIDRGGERRVIALKDVHSWKPEDA